MDLPDLEIGIQHPDHGVPLTITVALGETTGYPVRVNAEYDDDGWEPETLAEVEEWCTRISRKYASYDVARQHLLDWGVNAADLPTARQLDDAA